MPFFRFQVRTDTHVMHTEGAEFADTTAARVEAARRIGDLLREHANQLCADEEWQMNVTDEVGLILYVIQVSTSRAAPTHTR